MTPEDLEVGRSYWITRRLPSGKTERFLGKLAAVHPTALSSIYAFEEHRGGSRAVWRDEFERVEGLWTAV